MHTWGANAFRGVGTTAWIVNKDAQIIIEVAFFVNQVSPCFGLGFEAT